MITVSFPSNAVGFPVVHKVGASTEDGELSLLVQVDYDYAGFASAFGWIPCTRCNVTDGTIACAHREVGEMLSEALQYLRDHEGDEVDDPGYFS